MCRTHKIRFIFVFVRDSHMVGDVNKNTAGTSCWDGVTLIFVVLYHATGQPCRCSRSNSVRELEKSVMMRVISFLMKLLDHFGEFCYVCLCMCVFLTHIYYYVIMGLPDRPYMDFM